MLEVRAVSKSFGATPVLRSVSLSVARGEFLTILGESGSGKTTLLRIAAGFERPGEGEVWMDGTRIDTLPPNRRPLNTVFQHYALFPHLSVFENVAYGLRASRAPRADIALRVEQALEQVHLTGLDTRKPSQLSGGQQQRVALARALVNHPRVLLLDEPLSALDATMRRRMQGELKALQREIGISFVLVTHDQEEAMALSDRIALLHAGTLEQIDTPAALYRHPRTAYAAEFIGRTNLLRGLVRNHTATAGPFIWPLDSPDGEALFSLRPEHIRFSSAGAPPGAVRFEASVADRLFQGSAVLLTLQCPGGLRLTARVPDPAPPAGAHSFEFTPDDVVRIPVPAG